MNLIENQTPSDGIRLNPNVCVKLEYLTPAKFWLSLGEYSNVDSAFFAAKKHDRTQETKYRITETRVTERLIDLPKTVSSEEEEKIANRQDAATIRWQRLNAMSNKELDELIKKGGDVFQ